MAADDDEIDPLAAINAELREADVPGEDAGPWLPLESNPEIFTDFGHRSGGLPKEWAWVDILGIDKELLIMVPKPCAGVILLFPCTDNIYKLRARQKQLLLQNPDSPAQTAAYHVQQIAEFGNACGTIASVHALINGATIYNQDHSSPLHKFRDSGANMSAMERGRALLSTSDLRNSSDESAGHESAQTALPDRHGPDLDHHFVTFSPISDGMGTIDDDEHMHVVELDGTKVKPVDHGSIASILELREDEDDEKDAGKHSFLRAVAHIIRTQYMEVEPGSIEFSMMALCKVK